MRSTRQETIDTYNKSARELAEYFNGIGPRVKYIEKAFELAGNPVHPRVVEIGCGNGRDAKEIIHRSTYYQGSDISEEFIKLAQDNIPEADFIVADAVTIRFPENLDIVFAFASLLHLDKSEVRTVLQNAAKALRQGGIFYASLKYRPEYAEEIKEDRFGQRQFYFYNADVIAELAGEQYKVASTWREVIGHTDWFEIALERV